MLIRYRVAGVSPSYRLSLYTSFTVYTVNIGFRFDHSIDDDFFFCANRIRVILPSGLNVKLGWFSGSTRCGHDFACHGSTLTPSSTTLSYHRSICYLCNNTFVLRTDKRANLSTTEGSKFLSGKLVATI